MWLEALLVQALASTLALALFRGPGARRLLTIAATVTQVSSAAMLCVEVMTTGPVRSLGDILLVDALSAWIIMITAIVASAISLYSLVYIPEEEKHGNTSPELLRWYFPLLQSSYLLIFLTLSTPNLGILWIGLEATTLVTAFLVGYYRTEASVDAAWKYLIISSIGITLGLLGTVLMYASAVPAHGFIDDGLRWDFLKAHAGELDAGLVGLAFAFVLVGYGTKAGIAPMHTWLPDAHSQAPAPVSAFLSAIFLNVALYGLFRFQAIAVGAMGATPQTLLIWFGLLSVAVAVPFILVQNDYKRLFAYSSIEHIGIIVVGIGIGTPLAVLGAMLHMLNHSLSKCALFLAGGNISLGYGTHQMKNVTGVARAMPVTALAFLTGVLAITGSPPFGLFFSELLILAGAVQSGRVLEAAALLLLTSIIFAGFIKHALGMHQGEPSIHGAPGDFSRRGAMIALVLVLMVLATGVFLPSEARTLLAGAQATLMP
ncbi:MAG: hydrogenase 4 subunit F [Euryarchaeota archaeon]|nr:hydrogenase 4 subunit F [Euryarchaeota archaeon]